MSADTIAQETGLREQNLITYSDEEHITGTNLRQMPNAEAIVTVKQTTTLHRLLQGTRRMRGLDDLQRILMCLPHDVMRFMSDALSKDELSVSDVVLFTAILEAEEHKEHHLLYTIQKLVNKFEQLVLDRLYDLPQAEEIALFAKVGGIFDKDIFTDLVSTYANRRQSIDTQEYLTQVLAKLKATVEMAFAKEEISAICERINSKLMTPQRLKEMKSHVNITSNINRAVQSMHVRDYTNCRDQEIHRNIEHLRHDNLLSAQEIPFTFEQFADPTFGKTTDIINLKDVTNPEPGKSALSGVLNRPCSMKLKEIWKSTPTSLSPAMPAW